MKKMTLVIIIISILIFILGCCYSYRLYNELNSKNQITEKIEIDGSDATKVVYYTAKFLMYSLVFAFILYTLIAIGSIWLVYGLILLIIYLIKKYKTKKLNDKKLTIED